MMYKPRFLECIQGERSGAGLFLKKRNECQSSAVHTIFVFRFFSPIVFAACHAHLRGGLLASDFFTARPSLAMPSSIRSRLWWEKLRRMQLLPGTPPFTPNALPGIKATLSSMTASLSSSLALTLSGNSTQRKNPLDGVFQ